MHNASVGCVPCFMNRAMMAGAFGGSGVPKRDRNKGQAYEMRRRA